MTKVYRKALILTVIKHNDFVSMMLVIIAIILLANVPESNLPRTSFFVLTVVVLQLLRSRSDNKKHAPDAELMKEYQAYCDKANNNNNVILPFSDWLYYKNRIAFNDSKIVYRGNDDET